MKFLSKLNNSLVSETAKLVWSIEAFSCQQHRLCSPHFFAPTSDNRFQLVLYHYSLYNVKYVLFALIYNKHAVELKIESEIALLDISGKVLCVQENYWDYNQIENPSHQNVTIFQFSNDFSEQFLADDTLRIYCEIKVLSQPDHLPLHIPEELMDVVRNFHTHLEESQPSDVTLIVEGGKHKFRVHKEILIAHSPVFESLLKNNIDSKELEIHDLSGHICEELLRFFYTGMVLSTRQCATELLIAAHKYKITNLQIFCEHYLITTLTSESVVGLLLLANAHQAAHLKSKCIQFIIKNLETVCKTRSWKEWIVEQKPDLLRELNMNNSMQGNNLCADINP